MTETQIYIAVTVAIVLIVALLLTKTITFKGKGYSLFASKQDAVLVEKIAKSKVDVKSREGLDVKVSDVKENSDVKIR
jgi:preprotein translocase subunit SecG